MWWSSLLLKLYVSIFEIPRFRHPRLSNPRMHAKFDIVVQRAPWDWSQLPNRPKRIAVTKQKVWTVSVLADWQRMLAATVAMCTREMKSVNELHLRPRLVVRLFHQSEDTFHQVGAHFRFPVTFVYMAISRHPVIRTKRAAARPRA